MGCRLATLADGSGTIMYDSVTNWTLGPIFNTRHEAEDFLKFLWPTDPRTMRDPELATAYRDFLMSYRDEPEEEPYNEDDRVADARDGIRQEPNGY